ncbi:ribbon-helix-helix protein, CopG family [Halococcus sp. IIIV-5B]|nr:ribbon-helix-helix protein, CopG family [Halococcus sp. IIIV-5B]
MPRLTVSVDDDDAAIIEELSSDGGPYESKSEAMRACIQQYERIEELERENERLRNEKRAIIEQRDEHSELVAYVEGERDLQEMERERRNAPIWRRIKWLIMGRD